MLYKAIYNSRFGQITLLSEEKFLLGLWFNDQKYFGSNYNLDQARAYENEPIKLAIEWLDVYFAGKNPDEKKVPIKLNGSNFGKKVLGNLLQSVTFGQTISYKKISDQVQSTEEVKINKSRAVGLAVGHNPILLIIPCHRVIGSDGSLTGYAAGIDRKKELLEMETFLTRPKCII